MDQAASRRRPCNAKRHGVSWCWALAALVWASTACGQSTVPLPKEIPAQSLSAALDEYAQMTGMQIIYVSEIARGLVSNAVPPGLTPSAALTRLLEGTGLQYEYLNPRTIQLLAPSDSKVKGNDAREPSAAPPHYPARPETLEEIVVTATKRVESLAVVPMSAIVWTTERMEVAGIKGIEQLASLTPGVEFDFSSQWGSGILTNIAIRGINSQVGTSTTAIYLDDVPIQVRNGDFGNPYPVTFDLARVEVLRGPQGTLFGDSAEGGAVRFITNEPSTSTFSEFSRAETSVTDGGDPSYETGAAVGGPLAPGRVGARVSAWHRVDGGYVDRVNPFTGAKVDANANRVTTNVFRLALKALTLEGMQLLPTISYQSVTTSDSPTFYTYLSSPNQGIFRNGKLLAQPADDWFLAASLKALVQIGPNELTAVTSYFDRQSDATVDTTNVAGVAFLGGFGNPLGPAYPTSYADAVPTALNLHQNVLAQEIRIATPDPQEKLAWVAGVFLSRSRQEIWRKSYFIATPENPGIVTDDDYVDTSVAGFGEVNLNLLPHWKMTAGIRVAHTRSEFTEFAGGFAYVGVPADTHAVIYENPVTPKLSLSYELYADNLLYATIAKGFRIGGINTATPSQCNATIPRSYGSDSLWSYEIGMKNLLLKGRLRLDSSLYYMRWKGIQDNVIFDTCGFGYITNVGAAISKGFDFASEFLWTDRLRMRLAVAYIDARYTSTVANGEELVVSRGDAVGGVPAVAPPWSVYASARYEVPLEQNLSAYVMAQETMHSQNSGPFSVNNPAFSGSYYPGLHADPTVTELRIQSGLQWPHSEIRFVVDNVLDTHPILQQYSDAPGSSLLYAYTVRPRTMGIAGTWSF